MPGWLDKIKGKAQETLQDQEKMDQVKGKAAQFMGRSTNREDGDKKVEEARYQSDGGVMSSSESDVADETTSETESTVNRGAEGDQPIEP